MEVPWFGDRCILCLREDELTLEHIIPESLGGRLTSRFLCRACNSTLGHRLEAAARFDPSVRIAGQRLASSIPNIVKQLEERQRHIGKSEAGLSPGYMRDADFRVFSHKLPDGSLVQPTNEARKSIERMIQKAGHEVPPVQEALRRFNEAPENTRIEVAPGLDIVTWRIDEIQPDFSKSPLMNPLVPLKIAYEFLACHLGTSVYEDAPPLMEIRQTFQCLDTDSGPFELSAFTQQSTGRFMEYASKEIILMRQSRSGYSGGLRFEFTFFVWLLTVRDL